jgi:hypothetical protein
MNFKIRLIEEIIIYPLRLSAIEFFMIKDNTNIEFFAPFQKKI